MTPDLNRQLEAAAAERRADMERLEAAARDGDPGEPKAIRRPPGPKNANDLRLYGHVHERRADVVTTNGAGQTRANRQRQGANAAGPASDGFD